MTGDAPDRPIVLVSNRGPVTFHVDDDGSLRSTRGAGGLVSGLAPLVTATDATWIAAAMTDGDRQAATGGTIEANGIRTRLVAVDAEDYRMAYDVVCNATLWFWHHNLWELARRPRFDDGWRQAWASYVRVNEAFADVVADEAPDGAAVLVQDYHLTLLAPHLREARPDLRVVHFHHTPFSGPDLLGTLPTDARDTLFRGLAAHHACGFHSARWARNFAWCCDDLGMAAPPTFAAPLAAAADDLRTVAASDECAREVGWLDEQLGGRALIARVDRIELTKNLVRGFAAYDALLAARPEWRGRVVFGAFVYPSREGLAEYLAYRQEVESVVATVNERWATGDWTPILLDPSDNFPRSVAALRRYDVLVVNPVRDGLNLVCKEGPIVNERDGVVLLSTEAGAIDELGDGVTPVNPFDVSATTEAMAAALELDADERRARAARLATRAQARGPHDWLADQRRAAG